MSPIIAEIVEKEKFYYHVTLYFFSQLERLIQNKVSGNVFLVILLLFYLNCDSFRILGLGSSIPTLSQ